MYLYLYLYFSLVLYCSALSYGASSERGGVVRRRTPGTNGTVFCRQIVMLVTHLTITITIMLVIHLVITITITIVMIVIQLTIFAD